MPATTISHRHIFRIFFLVLYLIVLAGLVAFTSFIEVDQPKLLAYLASALIAYPAVYLAIPALLTNISLLVLQPNTGNSRWRTGLCYATAWLSSSIVLLLLFADYQLFQLYEYHFNSFVWNLITTPGGISSLGATLSTQLTFAAEAVAILLANGLLLKMISTYISRRNVQFISTKKFALIVSILLTILLAEEGVTAYSQYINDSDYYEVASIIPFHLETKASKLFARLNIVKKPSTAMRIGKGELNYPLTSIKTSEQAPKPNIVWLTAESFRWDLLDPEITPNLWKFSQNCNNFKQHYSGGNRTRMGMLSMFYGLYPPYWYKLQQAQVRPVLMDQIVKENYQLSLNTSQSFTYPELNDTVFAHISDDYKHELKSGPAWQRDHENSSNIISFVNERDKGRPFFSFMFYESTHAPYDFPEKEAIRTPYLEDVNYARLTSRLNDIQPLHNRYINAAHHVDAEVGRILDFLEQQHLLDSTIVVFTGDHGEEFMEKGKWGHGHSMAFPEQQVHVPLLLWLPHEPVRTIEHKTSHLQIPATILARMGVTNPASDYSSATSLFDTQLPYLVVGNHDAIGIIDKTFRIAFPFTSNKFFHYVVKDQNDNPIARNVKQVAIALEQEHIAEVKRECNRFLRPK